MKRVERVEKPIITSLLWTDLYKLTMGKAAFDYYLDLGAGYEFINRGRTKFPEGFANKLKSQVEMMPDLSLKGSEREFLEKQCPYLDQDYLDWLEKYRFNPKEVEITQQGGDLSIQIEGPWHRTIYWEVPLMTTISQLYFEETDQKPQFDYVESAREKGRRLYEAGARFLEFGTRRAFSTLVHRNVLEALVETARRTRDGGVLVGTSNVKLAQEYDLDVGGTNAHEWYMAHAALFGIKRANEQSLTVWAREYLGMDPTRPAFPKLATALPDTYTTEAFLHTLNLNPELLKYFIFFRLDSGNLKVKGDQILKKIDQLGWDIREKGVLPSDSLNTDTVIDLHNYFSPKTQDVAGIGTHITNDVGVKPLNMVIKAHHFIIPNRGVVGVAKLSDEIGKVSGEPKAVEEALTYANKIKTFI